MIPTNLPLVARRALLALTCAAALSAPVLAQDAPNPPPPPHQGHDRHGGEMQEHQLEHLTKALNLTPDQVTQVKAIQDDGRQQMMALRQDTSVAGPDKHAKMMSIHQAEEAKVRGLLNDDQKSKYDAMLTRMHERQEERRDHNHGGEQPPPPPAA